MAAALLFVGASPPARAATFPPQGDDSTTSMGLFRLMIDPAFRPLLEPAVGLSGYLGYESASARLTSPVLIDTATKIGRSDRHDRLLVGTVPVGLPSMGNIGYLDYPATPFLFAAAPPPTEEIMTQIRSLELKVSAESQCRKDPRIPFAPINWRMVYAGPDQGVTQRSIGMVQEDVTAGAALGAADPDFNARSFFNMFVEVNLPPIPLTVSAGVFPAGGAILYNDTALVITNLNLTTLPPVVIYIHGETAAVPMRFKTSNPPHWNADDVFGYLVLAGHGTIPLNCASEDALAAAVLGPLGTPAPELLIEGGYGSDTFPSPKAAYNSLKQEDIIKFTVLGAGAIQLRNLSHTAFDDPIAPPGLGNQAAYKDTNTVLAAQLSLDGLEWVGAEFTGATTLKIKHTEDRATTRLFDTEVEELGVAGNTPFGRVLLRESPIKPSAGKHTIRDNGGGFLVTSFFDVFLEASTDNGLNWIPADRSIRVQMDSPPCGSAGPRLGAILNGTKLTLWWSNAQFKLRSTADLSGALVWADVPEVSPLTVDLNDAQRYYNLICR